METIELLPSEKDAEGLLERIRKKTDETQEFARQADLLMLRAPLDSDRRYNYTMLLRTASEPGSHGFNIQGPKTVVEGDRTGISNIIQRVTKAVYSGPEGDTPLRKSPPPPVEPIQSLNLTALLQRMGEFVYRVYLPNFMKGYLRDTTCSVMITLTVTGNYTQAQYATLTIQIADASAGDFSVLNVLGTANLSGQLDPVLLNGFLPTVGERFTFLNAGAVNGTLFIFNRNIDNLPEHWEVSYFPTNAVLAVVAGNVSVPDQGSTFLLLTLGLLGLVTFRQQLMHKQS